MFKVIVFHNNSLLTIVYCSRSYARKSEINDFFIFSRIDVESIPAKFCEELVSIKIKVVQREKETRKRQKKN